MTMADIISTLYTLLSAGAHWFTTSPTRGAVHRIAYMIIETADRLKALMEEENAQLQEKGADAYFEGDDLTVVLFREGKQKYYSFPECQVDIRDTDNASERIRLKLEDPADENNITYYLHSKTMDYPQIAHSIQLSKEEATVLKKQIKDAETEHYGLDE